MQLLSYIHICVLRIYSYIHTYIHAYTHKYILGSTSVDIAVSEYSCRICLGDGPRSDFIAPCACSGGSKWVHRACLDQWRTTREDRAFSRCTECLTSYTLVSTLDDTDVEKCGRKTKFYCLVTRDLSFAFIVSQMVVGVLAWLVWQSDGVDKGYLIHLLHAGSMPVLFYYLCGLTLALAMIGLLFHSADRCPDCCRGCGDVCINISPYCWNCYCYRPYGYYGGGCGYGNGGGLVCCDCCNGCAACDCNACMGQTCGQACCDCSQVGGCEACAGMDLAGDAAIIVLALIVIMAIVGVFVVAYLGSKLVNEVVRAHISVLQKRGLAKDYVVADLEEDSKHIHTHT